MHAQIKTTKRDNAGLSTPPLQPILLPSGQVGSERRSVKDRQKHPRLVGADLYVARLGWCKDRTKQMFEAEKVTGCCGTSTDNTNAGGRAGLLHPTIPPVLQCNVSDTDTLPPSPPASLHDELTNPLPRPSFTTPPPKPSSNTHFDHSAIHASRPCYRCVTYMHSVGGIRRVFWTNELGEWEGGKVRDLVDALSGAMAGSGGQDDAGADGPGGAGGPLGNGLFVTKHEVLMLRRMMGRKDA